MALEAGRDSSREDREGSYSREGREGSYSREGGQSREQGCQTPSGGVSQLRLSPLIQARLRHNSRWETWDSCNLLIHLLPILL